MSLKPICFVLGILYLYVSWLFRSLLVLITQTFILHIVDWEKGYRWRPDNSPRFFRRGEGSNHVFPLLPGNHTSCMSLYKQHQTCFLELFRSRFEDSRASTSRKCMVLKFLFLVLILYILPFRLIFLSTMLLMRKQRKFTRANELWVYL